jgi:dolichol-phosphate mannosyltransferase
MRKSKVVVIIPTYNEAGNVATTTKALVRVFDSCKDYDMHILFVDDSSPDGTAKQIELLIKKYPFVHILNNKRKGGLGHAYKKGFAYAIDKLNADIFIQFDSDLQHDETVIPDMLSSLRDGSDMVLGARYIAGGSIPQAWPKYRKFLSVAGNWFIRVVMLYFSVHDWTTGYRAIKRNVAEQILPNMGNSAFNGYTYQIGFLVKSIQAGFKVSEIPFHFRDRLEGSSKLGPEYIFNTMRYIMKVRIDQIIHNRIFKFVMVGGFGTVVQLVALHFYRLIFTSPMGPISAYQFALILAIETAIVSNFTWNNLWTFKDRKLTALQVPLKFVQFNLASGGSLLFQFVIASVGERFIGLFTLFSFQLSSIDISIDTGLVYAVVGILVGMFWNFFAYNKLIWKKK